MNGKKPPPPKRHPSTPGIPGYELPRPMSDPPTERLLGELAAAEGRLLSHISDLRESITMLSAQDENVLAAVGGLSERVDSLETYLREEISGLNSTIRDMLKTDHDHAEKIGDLKVQLVAAGAGAGAKRGALTGFGAATVAILIKWGLAKIGINL